MKLRYQTAVTITAIALLIAGCSSSDPVEDEAPVEPHPLAGEVEQEAADDTEEETDDDHMEDDHMEAAETDDETGVLHMVAIAEMYSGDEERMGEVMFTQTEEGVEVHGRIETLDESLHGFHVHEFGECDPPDFESAGGHFNPGGHPHGAPDNPPDQRHAGDFGNLEFNEDGVAEFTFVDDVITLGAGKNDVAGKALIIHYEEDDLETQPTGDAGPRAGCGIIEASGTEDDANTDDDGQSEDAELTEDAEPTKEDAADGEELAEEDESPEN